MTGRDDVRKESHWFYMHHSADLLIPHQTLPCLRRELICSFAAFASSRSQLLIVALMLVDGGHPGKERRKLRQQPSPMLDP